MPLTEIEYKDYDRRWKISSIPDLLGLANENPWFPVPLPILASMLEEDASRPTDGLSMTNLVGANGSKRCNRCIILKKYTPYKERLDDLWARWRGTMYHTVLENYRQEGFGEIRFWAELPHGGMVHGKPDLIIPRLGALVDLKTTKSVPMYDEVWDDHKEQLQFYRWLMNNAVEHDGVGFKLETAKEVNFRTLGIWYADDKGVKPLEVRKTEDHPTKKGAKFAFKKVRVPDIWSDEAVVDVLEPRYQELVNAMNVYEDCGELPEFPEGVDPIRMWAHKYSPVAYQCLDSHYKENN